MRVEFRPLTALALLSVVLVAVAGASVVTADLQEGDDADPALDTVVLEDGSELWPYTSRGTNFDERTLAINVVVYGNSEVTETLLRQAAVGDWDELEDEEQDVAPAEELDATNETTIAWGTADGAVRYTYVDPADGDEQWLTESYQLADGDYLGARHHVRAYNDPDGGDWTAMQAHLDYWDWFHLRHTVPTTEESQLHLEEEFVDRWYVESLHRERFGNDDGSDADGWVTVVEIDNEAISLLFGVLIIGSFGASRFSREFVEWRTDESVQAATRALLVAGSIVGLYAAIRFGAIGVERLLPGINPKLIVAVFYPILVLGMPICAYLAARKLDGIPAFTAASVGFAVAMFLDYTYLGVMAIPLDTFVHRAALAVAIGFIAAGASRTARRPATELGLVRTGTLLWTVAICLPLLQFV